MSNSRDKSPSTKGNSKSGPTLTAPPGLKGVVVTDTALGDVRGLEGFYHYRQYSAIDLAKTRSLEGVWHLLFEGQLPDADTLAAFRRELAPYRILDPDLLSVLPGIARLGDPWNPLDALRTALSLSCGTRGLGPTLDLAEDRKREDALFVCAQIPTLVAALWRLRHGLEPLAPDPEASISQDYLRMIDGEQPSNEVARALEQYWISTIDHGFNASTFTARVIAATGADMGSSVVGALGAFSGPLHGGALARSLDTLDKIGTPEKIDSWIRERIASGKRIMGFGHAVYRAEDPRSRLLLGIVEDLGGGRAEFARQVERRVIEILDEVKPGRDIYTNVEFYAGVLLERCGIPQPLFTSTFASSRVIGWCANILEQAMETQIIRPSARYIGPSAPQPVPELVSAA
jgi:citrate synthase